MSTNTSPRTARIQPTSKSRFAKATLSALCAAGAAFAGFSPSTASAEDAHVAPDALVCVLSPTTGSKVAGTVTFTAGPDNSVTVHAVVQGLEPGSTHAFHVHEFGDLRSEDGSAAGSHYNPEGHNHGLPDQEQRHAGDLGNLKADESGKADYTIKVDNISLTGPKNPVVGHAVIVHAKVDDGGQPVGNAGARIAQGVIGIAKPAAEKK